MKIIPTIAYGFLLCLSAWTGSALALEKPAAVKSHKANCQQSTISFQEGKFVAEFQIASSLPAYNSYATFLGDGAISANLDAPEACRATWLIVMDTSDPTGRELTIAEQTEALARFLSFVSPTSRVGIYSLSRELVPVNDPEKQLSMLGIGMSKPIWQRDQETGKVLPSPEFAPVFQMFGNIGTSQSQMNTNLWIGLIRTLREALPGVAQGHNALLPKGILLLSDGVDESSTGAEDLNQLIQEARKLGVPIHTIGFPHKDKPKKGRGMDVTARHKGFSYLQRLASETGGRFLSYEMFNVDIPEGAQPLKDVVESTEVSPMKLSFPIQNLKEGQDITLTLRQGNDKNVASLNISQYDVAHVLGDFWLHQQYSQTLKARQAEESKQSDILRELGKSFIQRICPLPIRDELFNYTDVDEPFARRARQILDHLDKHPAILKKARSSDSELNNLCDKVAAALMNVGAPLPEVPQEEEPSRQPIVINNAAPSTSSSSSEASYAEEDSLQDWVWWSLGIGGSMLAVLFFWLITRVMNRPEAPVRVFSEGQPGGGEGAYTGPTKPVLASLVNTANPTQSWIVSSTSCRVGRHASNDIALPFSYVSGVQFILSRSTSGQWELRDAHSTNGTMVNGKKVSTAHLHSGDVIRIADLELEFKLR